MRRRNIIAAVVLLALGAVYGVLTAQLPVRSLPDTPGPPFFPWINTIVILALSATLLVQGWMAADGPLPPQAAGRRRASWALGVFVVYLAILPGFGFILATAPFFAALMLLFGETRALRVAAGALIATGLLYLLFRHGFNVYLPTGLLKGIVP
ncbi:MAG: tripartite tricarboxylate transporter TctB family protein [Proteobacteria bacterium]|nr:tripartite tricarboxylate transporter TctB family protein [Pseudomonadota bacterium]